MSTESGHINPALEAYQDVLASQSQTTVSAGSRGFSQVKALFR